MKKTILCLIIIVIILIIAYLLIPKNIIEDNNSDYVVKNFNDQIVIDLESNPTTGYAWEVNYDEEYLSFTAQEYFPEPVDEEIVGSGGREVFTFNPIKVGKTELIFDYKREWEEEPIETQHFKFKIVE